MNIRTILANPALAACWLSEAPRSEVEAFAARLSRRPASIPAEGQAFLQQLRDRLLPQGQVLDRTAAGSAAPPR